MEMIDALRQRYFQCDPAVPVAPTSRPITVPAQRNVTS